MADDSYDAEMLRQVGRIADGVKLLAGWVVFAIIVSIVGGIIWGIQVAHQQDRLEKILNGDTSSVCDDMSYLDPGYSDLCE